MVLSLNDADRAMFSRLRISDDIIRAAGVRRVDAAEAARVLCRPVASDLSGILFPYRNPRTEQTNSSCALRRDDPPMVDGKPSGKYLLTSGRQHIYFPPSAASRVGDCGVPLVIVESQKAVLGIESMLRRTGRVMLPIGINGCYGWRGVIGKEVNAEGSRVDEKGMLPDLEELCLPGREAILLLDSNVATNDKVAAAERRLAAALAVRGLTVRVGRIPTVAGVNGPDDFLAVETDAAMLQVIDDALAPEAKPKRNAGSASTSLINLVHDAGGTLFHSPERVAYLAYPWKNRNEIINLRTDGREFLSGIYWRAYRSALPAAALSDAIAALSAEAVFEGKPRAVFVRVAHFPDKVILDLGDDEHRVVVMTAEGWSVTTTSEVAFERPRCMRPLPAPVGGETLDRFLALFPFDRNSPTAQMVIGWLAAALGSAGPYPLLLIVGEQGGGKSMSARFLKRLIDDDDEPLRSGSSIRDAESVGVAARASRVVVIDNLSTIPAWLSDVLCSVSTGGTVGGRALYTDATERRLKLKRPAILTAINKVVTEPDLIDRTLVVEWPLLTDGKRRDEEELNEEFESLRPGALGVLCTAVSTAIRNRRQVNLPELPRLADFVNFATAAEPALGLPHHSVYQAVIAAREETNREELEGSALALAIRDICVSGWEGTMKQLLSKVNHEVDERDRPLGNAWPRTPKAMGNHLRRWLPILRREGCAIKSLGPKEDGIRYELRWSAPARSGRSASSASSGSAAGAVDTAPTPSVGNRATAADVPELPEVPGLPEPDRTVLPVRIAQDGGAIRFSRPRQ